ncbi:MAG: YSC84-related protein [Phycisphaerales bacterium]
MKNTIFAIAAATMLAPVAVLPSCRTAPAPENRETFVLEAAAAKQWFIKNVKGVESQLNSSAAYIVFPSVGQAGLIVGGSFGRGAVYDKSGKQVGWAVLNKGSIGLQIGAQGFKMLMVLEDDKTFRAFKDDAWRGSVAATAVAAEEGATATAPFREGLAIYVGQQKGLMAGMDVALANIRYKSLADVE